MMHPGASRYCHNLSAFLSLFEAEGLLCAQDPSDQVIIRHLSFDTRDLMDKTLFFCKGAHFKPEYLRMAAENGAVAYVSEVRYEDVSIPAVLVSDIRRAMSVAALFHYEQPAEKLKTVGITGTKGKSTTAYYVKAILDAALSSECAILSSIDNFDGVIREEAHLTTPEAIPLQQHFVNAYESGLTHLVMEVSSQALKYGRVDGVCFDVACFHNIGTDHISPVEHPDFEDYFASKLKIFNACRVGCVNTDVAYADRALQYAKTAGCRVLTYGSHPEDDIYCSSVKKDGEAIRFTVTTASFAEEFAITMPGLFNVQNALCAIAVCTALGIPPQAIREGLAIARAAGRMEVFTSRDSRVIALVDYAHNRMSFGALYDSVAKEYPDKTVITVFGCPGGKAYLRRKDLGELSGRHSSLVIVTEEDSGEEPFSQIAADIAASIEAEGGRYFICEDRGEAIRRAICENGSDKIILITGKGRETRQKRGTLYMDTPSDVDYVERYLAEYDDSTVGVVLG
ncbi:MAG: UDP-N-acetylmuramoyl-L-alanyl-D-glutamate--2,6-diaminopimelate ligase [Ruminococcaceae bacterium]|nr:UDP-N-acetylmuramoyl-L-alanyl-D-glutamate--2,6-diaminopimelate ligase [Oscillospiraceae bacterium]